MAYIQLFIQLLKTFKIHLSAISFSLLVCSLFALQREQTTDHKMTIVSGKTGKAPICDVRNGYKKVAR